jgi:hypothetical protein
MVYQHPHHYYHFHLVTTKVTSTGNVTFLLVHQAAVATFVFVFGLGWRSQHKMVYSILLLFQTRFAVGDGGVACSV